MTIGNTTRGYGVIACVALAVAVAVGACGSEDVPAKPASPDAGLDGARVDAGPDAAGFDAGDAARFDAGSDAGGLDAGPDGGACTSTYTDISAGQGSFSGVSPSALIDAANAKLLVITDNGANADKPALFRCNLDGAACTHTDVSAGEGSFSGKVPSAVMDAAAGKLLIVTEDGANSNRPALFRCNLDGTACTYTDISAGQGGGSGFAPSAVIDAVNAKLLVVTQNGANGNRPGLFRCNLDGSACTHTDVSAGQGLNSGWDPSVVIDAANSKLLVVTRNDANSGKPALFRCNLDGSACTHTDISAGQGANSGWGPAVVLDTANGKLLVVTENDANFQKPALFRCNVDGTACTYADISAGQANDSGYFASAVVDATNGKLLVVTENVANAKKPSLFRCNLDGSACTHTDVSLGQGSESGNSPSVVLNAASGKLLVVTRNGFGSNGKPALFSVCLP